MWSEFVQTTGTVSGLICLTALIFSCKKYLKTNFLHISSQF